MLKYFSNLYQSNIKFTLLLGLTLFNRFPQSIDDLLRRIEAFLVNNSLNVLGPESLGKLEQSLHQDFVKVKIVYLPFDF